METYQTAILACTESALVTWIGLLLYEVCSLAPNGHVVVRIPSFFVSIWSLPLVISQMPCVALQTNYDVGYVMASVLPVFFGISQCLIVVRVALSRELTQSRRTTSRTRGPSSRTLSFAAPSHLFSRSDKHRSDYPEPEPEEHTLDTLSRPPGDTFALSTHVYDHHNQ